MPKLDKFDAFSLIVKALDKGDEKRANEMMRIITKSIMRAEKENKKSLNQIEIFDEREVAYFKELLE